MGKGCVIKSINMDKRLIILHFTVGRSHFRFAFRPMGAKKKANQTVAAAKPGVLSRLISYNKRLFFSVLWPPDFPKKLLLLPAM